MRLHNRADCWMPATPGDAVAVYPDLVDTRHGIAFGRLESRRMGGVVVGGQHWPTHEPPRRLVTRTDALIWTMCWPGVR